MDQDQAVAKIVVDSLSEGTHAVTVTTTDNAGRVTTQTMNFTVDKENPTVGVTVGAASKNKKVIVFSVVRIVYSVFRFIFVWLWKFIKLFYAIFHFGLR